MNQWCPNPRIEREAAEAWLLSASLVELGCARGNWASAGNDTWHAWLHAWYAAIDREFPIPDPLPMLEGTPAQIKWAEDIRRAAIIKVREGWVPRLSDVDEAERPAVRAQASERLAQLVGHTLAKWWINNRLSLT